jgi:Fe(3+) dicitrate transport protein
MKETTNMKRKYSLNSRGAVQLGTSIFFTALTAVTLAGELGGQVFLPPVTVTGQSRDPALLPGAVSIVDQAAIDRIQPRSTEDVLRRVPGVFVKGEEENAIVTNISVRGLPAGDYKTLVLLDGVPVQPGIFVGNSRYYNPRVHRMSGVEVLKGAASLRYGPNTIGGVINFISRMPEDGVSVSAQYGSWNSRQGIVEFGGSNEAGDARFGVIALRSESDGFMDKGVDTTDVMVRAETAIGDNQFIGFKFLYYDTEANISYRGLFPEAYKAGKRFNPAPDDFFLTDRKAFDIVHEWQVNPDVNLQTILFWSEMSREYWRFQLDADNPTTVNSEGFRVWNYRDEVQGNNRYFTRTGVDSRLTLNHGLGGFSSQAEVGVRYMEEDMLDQTVRADRATPRNPNQTLLRNRLDSAQSLAFFAQNRFDFSEALSVTGGVRVETYEQKRDNLASAAPSDTFSNTEVMPGLGATYRLSDTLQVFGSVYRAFAPPLVGSVVGRDDAPTDAETSVNVEFGVRGGDGPFSYQVTAFQMDFSNQVDPGVSGIRSPNEGSALIQGLEAAMGYAFGNGILVDANVTWIPTAEFGEDRPGDALEGNRLPYSAEWMTNLTIAYEVGAFQTALLFNYVGETFGDGMNVRELTTESGGTWGGRIPSYFTLDLTARFAINENLSVFGSVNNLTDEKYIAGLRQGIYVGPERNGTLGVRYTF